MSTKNLRALLDGDYAEIRDRVRWWLSQPGNEPVVDLPMEEHRAKVLAWVQELTAEGDTGRGFPAEYGGQDNVGGSVASFGALAFGDLSLLVKCGVQFGLFGGAILHLGTARHHERYLRAATSMELPGCFAMTETGHGSNVQALGTTATYDPEAEEFVVHTPSEDARKDYIGNAARDGRMAVVFAQLIAGCRQGSPQRAGGPGAGEDRGVHALLVPLRDEDGDTLAGVRIEDCGAKLGLDGVDNGRIWFDHVRVPRENLLDRYAQVAPDGTYTSAIENPTKRFFTMLGTLIQGRISVSGASISATKVALTIAIRRALTRRQFGVPGEPEALLMDYRTHQRRLLIPLAATYALSFAQDRLIAELHEVFTNADTGDRERRELETLAAGVKAIATWHATETIQACREACGGAGYLRQSRFAALKADTDVFTTFEGDNTVLLQLAAKNLLTDYKDAFGELDPLGTAQFIAGQAFGMLAEKIGIPGRDEGGDLLARKTQLELFKWRHEHVLGGVARRLKKGIGDGRDPFSVLVDCQDHVLTTARSWVDLVVLEAFAEVAGRDPVLDKLCSLYALSRIEAERGWYQEHGKLTATRSKAVIKAVNELLAEIRPHAEMLVDAFGVPDACLGDAKPVAQAAA
ncbi:acyl-CoA dehydrogenase family protein [Candidatus Solirubrobacter pratensis]|uniref:acyl-CoA dehydrogenase family protein n=1 Tax=Candidatus Solirubrobacter pratensis TaxID=1298857 RepID=UPI0004009596|nr:acyl-CoA dehydrogenase [Candidatus Solirubrobacter pratensis]